MIRFQYKLIELNSNHIRNYFVTKYFRKRISRLIWMPLFCGIEFVIRVFGYKCANSFRMNSFCIRFCRVVEEYINSKLRKMKHFAIIVFLAVTIYEYGLAMPTAAQPPPDTVEAAKSEADGTETFIEEILYKLQPCSDMLAKVIPKL